jgi:hypothetical protein
MFEQAYKVPTGMVHKLCGALGMSFIRADAELTAVHLKPDGKGGWVRAKHPNKLKALLGFHDVRHGHKCITTAYVTYLALMHQTDATAIGDFKYHDSGIGTGDEAVGDTSLGTPWGGARDVGTQVASTNTYTSVATTTYNATKAITEHGLFNASSSVTLMDRTKFSAINVVSGDGIQWTFVITFTAGG